MKISISAKQLGKLYHYTTKQALLKILTSGKLALSTGRGMSVEHKHQAGKNFFASFTRSRFGGYHYNEGGRVSVYEDTKVMITIDGDALSAREKFVPRDYWEKRGDLTPGVERNKEAEERLVSDREEIPFLKYIKKVDLIQRGVLGDIETYGMDRGKFKVNLNERHEGSLGSIILRLKKNGIPFSFYDNMDDWAKKRGEFSYTGKLGVRTELNSGYAMKSSYVAMKSLIEALSDIPYEQLGKKAKDICSQVSRYPNDIASVFNDYENFRKPDANATMRQLALKIARVLKRRGFNTKEEAGKFLAEKANVHYKAQQKRDTDERNAKIVPHVIEALSLPIDEWQESGDNVYYSARKMFLEIKDRWSYLYDEAVRVVDSVLTTDSPEVNKLRALMKTMNLVDGSDVVANIWYEKVKPRNDSST